MASGEDKEKQPGKRKFARGGRAGRKPAGARRIIPPKPGDDPLSGKMGRKPPVRSTDPSNPNPTKWRGGRKNKKRNQG